jgi:hypothetical protein
LTKEPADGTGTPAPGDNAAGGKPVVPAEYSFTAPKDGPGLDAGLIAEFSPIARELGLDNASAQRLVDFWNKNAGPVATKAAEAVINAQLAKDRAAAEADPDIGPKLQQIQADIGRAYDVIGNAKLVADFKAAMDYTGIGNNPAFIKVFHQMAQRMIEGKPASGSGPSALGQGKPSIRPTAASAMYPNLPSSSH